MCSETVGWVRKRAWAARENEPSSATFAKISSCLRSTGASIGAARGGVQGGRDDEGGPSDNEGARGAPRPHRAAASRRQWQPQPPPQQPPPPPIGADGASLMRAPTFTPTTDS